MKKASIFLVSLLAIGLVSCNNTNNTVKLTVDDYQGILGTYYGKSGTLTVKEDSLVVEGNVNLTLKPKNLTHDENELPVISYDNYRISLSQDDNKVLVLEQKDGKDYKEVGTFMPDITALSGAYGGYAFDDDYYGDSYNILTVISSEYNPYYDVFYAGTYYTYAQLSDIYYTKSYFKLENGKLQLEIGLYDYEDNYLYNNLRIKSTETSSFYLYDEKEETAFYPEIGFLRNSYFYEDGTIKTLSLNEEDKYLLNYDSSITESRITLKNDDRGAYVEFKLGEETIALQATPFGIKEYRGEEVQEASYNSILGLLGDYSYRGNSVNFVENVEFDDDFNATYTYELNINDAKSEFEYVLAEHKKSLKTVVGSDTYVIIPEKTDTAIKVYKNDEFNYYVNKDQFVSLFANEFVYHEIGTTGTLSIDMELKVTLDSTTLQGSLIYSPNQKYPYLAFDYAGEELMFKIYDTTINSFLLVGSNYERFYFYTSSVASVYSDYVSQGPVDLTVTAEKVVVDGTSYDYEIKPYYDDYSFTNKFSLVYYVGELPYRLEFNLAGMVTSYAYEGEELVANKTHILKSVFDDMVGTYYLEGKYGPEKFKLTSDGHFYADTINDENNGLVEDVEMEFSLGIVYSPAYYSYIPTIAFGYEGMIIYLYKEDYHLTTFGSDYVREELFNYRGVYGDDTTAIELRGDDLYIDAVKYTITDLSSEGDTTIVNATSDDGTTRVLTFTTTGSAKAVSYSNDGENYSNLSKLDVSLDAFVGEHVSSDGYTLTVSKTTDEITGIVSYQFLVSDYAYDYAFTYYNGNLAIKVSAGFDTYYLYLSGETVVLEYSGGLLPPPPPLPQR